MAHVGAGITHDALPTFCLLLLVSPECLSSETPSTFGTDARKGQSDYRLSTIIGIQIIYRLINDSGFIPKGEINSD